MSQRIVFTPEQLGLLRQRRARCQQEKILHGPERATRINHAGAEVPTTWGALWQPAITVYDALIAQGAWERSQSLAEWPS